MFKYNQAIRALILGNRLRQILNAAIRAAKRS